MKNVNRKKILAIITAIIIIAIAVYIFASVTKDNSVNPVNPVNRGSETEDNSDKTVNPVNRGAVWSAVERTLGSYDESNSVKEDLIKRGLVKLEGSGYIRVQEIEELVREKVYVIDKQGYLQFGPAYVPPKTQ